MQRMRDLRWLPLGIELALYGNQVPHSWEPIQRTLPGDGYAIAACVRTHEPNRMASATLSGFAPVSK